MFGSLRRVTLQVESLDGRIMPASAVGAAPDIIYAAAVGGHGGNADLMGGPAGVNPSRGDGVSLTGGPAGGIPSRADDVSLMGGGAGVNPSKADGVSLTGWPSGSGVEV